MEVKIESIDYLAYFKRNPHGFAFPADIQEAIWTGGHP